tara:strand:- start:420 stop:662 length:243 start_codon:yes stop_codon:yes gene_type:complete
MSTIKWQVAEANENGTLLEFTDGEHKVWIRMSERFTSSDTTGTLDYEDIHKYLAIHQDKVKELFALSDGDDFKDEGVFEL